MKLLASIAAVASADWTQPSYWDVFQAHQSRASIDWGFPAGVRAAAHWSLCPELETPENASDVACDSATCAVICLPGYQSTGQRRTRCRYNKVKGFFWAKELAGCATCDPEEPTVADTNVDFACTINPTKNRKVCIGWCPAGANFPGGKPNKKMKAKCKCPKDKVTGTRTCGWLFKKTTVTSFDDVKCENVVTTTEASTVAPTDTSTTSTDAPSGSSTTPTTTPTTTTTTPTTTSTEAAAGFTVAACEAALAGNANANEICLAIEHQNTFRVLHQVEPFGIPDASLCDGAQTWAQTNADSNSMFHSSGTGQGENLAMGTGGLTMTAATTLWQNEVDFWNFETAGDCMGVATTAQCPKCTGGPNNNPLDCLHFTQNVWKGTTHVCYGKAVSAEGTTFVAARYVPAGNVVGQFDANVLPQA